MRSAPREPAGPVWTIVLAAGSGARFGGAKQFELIGDRRVVDWSTATAAMACDGVVVVYPPDDARTQAPDQTAAGHRSVAGGASRAASVCNGLATVPAEAAVICVHDAARPFASPDLYAAVIAAVREGADGCVPALPVTDTVKRVRDGWVVDTLERAELVAVQTPQAFRAEVLRRAHADTAIDPVAAAATDDAALVERAGGRVAVVPGEAWNRKITHPDDLAWARRLVDDGLIHDGPVPGGTPA